jgi:hypothetical protein
MNVQTQAMMLARYYAQRDLKAHIIRGAARIGQLGPMAQAWLAEHPELIAMAVEAIQKTSLRRRAKMRATTRPRQAVEPHKASAA